MARRGPRRKLLGLLLMASKSNNPSGFLEDLGGEGGRSEKGWNKGDDDDHGGDADVIEILVVVG